VTIPESGSLSRPFVLGVDWLVPCGRQRNACVVRKPLHVETLLDSGDSLDELSMT